MKTITERYGSHKLTIEYKGNDFAQVSVEDLSEFNFPLIFSRHMNYAQANAYLEIFKNIGFVDVVDTAIGF